MEHSPQFDVLSSYENATKNSPAWRGVSTIRTDSVVKWTRVFSVRIQSSPIGYPCSSVHLLGESRRASAAGTRLAEKV